MGNGLPGIDAQYELELNQKLAQQRYNDSRFDADRRPGESQDEYNLRRGFISGGDTAPDSPVSSLVDTLAAALSIGGVITGVAGGKKAMPLARLLGSNVPYALSRVSQNVRARKEYEDRRARQDQNIAQRREEIKKKREALAGFGLPPNVLEATWATDPGVQDTMLTYYAKRDDDLRDRLGAFSGPPTGPGVPSGTPEGPVFRGDTGVGSDVLGITSSPTATPDIGEKTFVVGPGEKETEDVGSDVLGITKPGVARVRVPTDEEYAQMTFSEKRTRVNALEAQHKQDQLDALGEQGFVPTGFSIGPDGKIRETFGKEADTTFIRAYADTVDNLAAQGIPFNLAKVKLNIAQEYNVDPKTLNGYERAIVSSVMTANAQAIRAEQIGRPPGEQLHGINILRAAADRTREQLGDGVQSMLGDMLKIGTDMSPGKTTNQMLEDREKEEQRELDTAVEMQSATTTAKMRAKEGKPPWDPVTGVRVTGWTPREMREKISDVNSSINKLRDLLGAATQLNTQDMADAMSARFKKLGAKLFETDSPDVRAIGFIEDFRSDVAQFMKSFSGSMGTLSDDDVIRFEAVVPSSADSVFKIRRQGKRLMNMAIAKLNALTGAREGDSDYETFSTVMKRPVLFLQDPWQDDVDKALEKAFSGN